MDQPNVHLTHVLNIRLVLDLQRTHRSSDREQTAGKQPLTEVVIITQPSECSRRYGGDDTLKPFQITGSVNLLARTRIARNEISEPELPLDVLAHLLRQGLGTLDDESHLQLIGRRAHGRLRTLHKERHGRVILANQLAQVHTRIQFLGRRWVTFVQHESDIGDDTQHVVTVLAVQFHRLVVTGSE